MIITSLNNDKIKNWKKLRTKKGRDQTGLFLVEGLHLVLEAYKKDCIKELILLEETVIPVDIEIEPTYVTESVLKAISSLETPSTILAVCKKLDNPSITGNNLLIIDEIQDPGNLGTIIRSAVAFNIDTVVLGTNTVDIYNEKCLRASQGMLFHINFVETELSTLIPKLKEDGYHIWGTVVDNGVNLKEVNKPNKYAIIIGNEGNGINPYLASLCDELLLIKMSNKCESLNVGIACSIILYQLSE